MIIPDSITWETEQPWQVTYWKTLPVGYEVTFQVMAREHTPGPEWAMTKWEDHQEWYASPVADNPTLSDAIRLLEPRPVWLANWADTVQQWRSVTEQRPAPGTVTPTDIAVMRFLHRRFATTLTGDAVATGLGIHRSLVQAIAEQTIAPEIGPDDLPAPVRQYLDAVAPQDWIAQALVDAQAKYRADPQAHAPAFAAALCTLGGVQKCQLCGQFRSTFHVCPIVWTARRHLTSTPSSVKPWRCCAKLKR